MDFPPGGEQRPHSRAHTADGVPTRRKGVRSRQGSPLGRMAQLDGNEDSEVRTADGAKLDLVSVDEVLDGAPGAGLVAHKKGGNTSYYDRAADAHMNNGGAPAKDGALNQLLYDKNAGDKAQMYSRDKYEKHLDAS